MRIRNSVTLLIYMFCTNLLFSNEHVTSLKIYYIDWHITTNVPFRVEDIRKENLIVIKEKKEIENIKYFLENKNNDLFLHEDGSTPAIKRSHDHRVIIDVYEDNEILKTYAFTRFYFYEVKEKIFFHNNIKNEITNIISFHTEKE